MAAPMEVRKRKFPAAKRRKIRRETIPGNDVTSLCIKQEYAQYAGYWTDSGDELPDLQTDSPTHTHIKIDPDIKLDILVSVTQDVTWHQERELENKCCVNVKSTNDQSLLASSETASYKGRHTTKTQHRVHAENGALLPDHQVSKVPQHELGDSLEEVLFDICDFTESDNSDDSTWGYNKAKKRRKTTKRKRKQNSTKKNNDNATKVPRKRLKMSDKSVCEKSSKVTSSQKKKVENALGLKLYGCEYCTDMFDSKSSLLTHKKIHMECGAACIPVPDQVTNEDVTSSRDRAPFLCVNEGSDGNSTRSHDSLNDPSYVSRDQDSRDHMTSFLGESHDISRDEETPTNSFMKNTGNSGVEVYTRETLPDNRHTCKICGQAMLSKYHLDRHMTQHVQGKDKRLKCDQCQLYFRYKGEVSHHILTVHDKIKPFKCAHCDRTFTRQYILNRHIAREHPDTTMDTAGSKGKYSGYDCEICDMRFYSLGNLKRHQVSVHGPSAGQGRDDKYKCGHCDRSFLKIDVLKKHIVRKHSQSKDFVCAYCAKKFVSKEYVKSHIQRTHLRGKSEPEHVRLFPFGCDRCHKTYETQAELEKHAIKHRNRAVHKCSLCDKGYYTKDYLLDHVSADHEGVKRHKCDMCDTAYTNGYSLQRHRQIKHGAKKRREVSGVKQEMGEREVGFTPALEQGDGTSTGVD